MYGREEEHKWILPTGPLGLRAFSISIEGEEIRYVKYRMHLRYLRKFKIMLRNHLKAPEIQ
jgi:hypothetical protein